jgi:threonine dehydrogenase-like Zn-dependent dehydrogenase
MEPAVLQGDQLGRVQRVWRRRGFGERKHAIAHYLDLAADGRVDLRPMLTHTFGLEQWRDAFLAIANQGESGAVKVAIDYR